MDFILCRKNYRGESGSRKDWLGGYHIVQPRYDIVPSQLLTQKK